MGKTGAVEAKVSVKVQATRKEVWKAATQLETVDQWWPFVVAGTVKGNNKRFELQVASPRGVVFTSRWSTQTSPNSLSVTYTQQIKGSEFEQYLEQNDVTISVSEDQTADGTSEVQSALIEVTVKRQLKDSGPLRRQLASRSAKKQATQYAYRLMRFCEGIH